MAYSVILLNSSSLLKKLTICSRKRTTKAPTRSIVVNASYKISLKKRFARGMLNAPMEFPRRAPDASVKPRGTRKRRAWMLRQIVSDASSITPRIPPRKTRTSKAHHSLQSMAVEGKLTLRYWHQPLKESRSIDCIASAIVGEQRAYKKTVSKRTASLTPEAMARPAMPKSRPFTKSRHRGM